jgi:aspartyl-tRNA(Asn)/glutamyl-tRNA(Gln) amidotransferase subunit A
MASNELLSSTIADLAPRIRSGEVSPVELTEAALSHAETIQPVLNTFITLMSDQAMAQAREEEAAIARGEYKGPLQGIPIGLKDNLATAGIRTTLGTRVLADYVPDEDAEVAVRCRAAGAVLLGKENMEEFAAGATSNNPHFGPVRNPWATEHVPGGSSGGGGANVATEVTFASLGTDLGGSVRLPGSFCGVVGLKQTFGRVSQRGLLVTSFNGDHIGPMTRSVADSAIMLQALAGHDPLDPSSVPVPVPDYSAALGRSIRGLRMGVPSNYFFEELDPEVEEATRRAVAALEELGAVSVPVELPMMKYIGAVRMAAMADSVVTHEPFLRANREDYGPDVLYRTLGGQFVLGHHYSKAMKAQRLIQEDYARAFQNVDFIVTPTTPTCAPRIDTPYIEHAGEMHRVRGPGSGLVSRNTSPLNSTGHPAITVPCGLNSGGLPIGLQFIAAGFREEVLFQVAAAYEQVSPTQGRRPPVLEG